MLKIEIFAKKDFLKLQKQLGEFNRKQLPYALAQALNELAIDSRPIIQESFKDKLTIRNKSLLKKGVQINFAKKADWPYIQSEIGLPMEFEFLAEHVTGADRKGRSSHGRAVPIAITRAASGKIAKSQRPSALLKKKNVYAIKTRGGKEIIIRREDKKERYPIKIMYGFTKNAKIKGDVAFETGVTNMFNSRYDMLLGKHLSKAIANAK